MSLEKIKNKPTFHAVNYLRDFIITSGKVISIESVKNTVVMLYNKGFNLKQIINITGYKENTVKTIRYNYSFLISKKPRPKRKKEQIHAKYTVS